MKITSATREAKRQQKVISLKIYQSMSRLPCAGNPLGKDSCWEAFDERQETEDPKLLYNAYLVSQ